MTAAQMAALHAAAFVVPRPWSAGEISDLLASPLCLVLSEPQGFILGRVVAGEAEVLTIAVEPAAQGRGVGGRLLAGFLAEAAQRGAATVFLEVAAPNGAARALYAKAGFVETGLRRGYFGSDVDAVVMRRAMAR